TKTIEYYQARAARGRILGHTVEHRANMRIGLEYGTQHFGLIRVDRDGECLLFRQLEDGAVVGWKRVASQQTDFKRSGRVGPVLKGRSLLRSGPQRQRLGSDRSAAEQQSQIPRARLGAVVAHRNEDFQYGRVGGRTPQADLAQSAVLGR